MRHLYDLGEWESIGYSEGNAGPAWFRVENGQYVTIRARTIDNPVGTLTAIMYEDSTAEDPTEWTDGDARFLGTFEHYEEFQFWVPEGYGVKLLNYVFPTVPEGFARLEIHKAQGQNWVMPPVEGESFARVMERAPRNEEYEQMLAVTMRNVERRMAQERSETARVLAEMDRQHRAELAEARAVGSAYEGAGKPRKKVVAPSVDGGAPDETADENEGGGGGNDDNAVA